MKIEKGNKYGRWTADREGKIVGRNRYWFCVCECGKEKEVFVASLYRGLSKSCGCLNSELASARKKTHGLSRTVEHNVWLNMRQRCNDPNKADYANYGGRGIKVCDRWSSFENFLSDMGHANGKTLERKDNNKGYEPSNCVWATKKTQANNRRSNRLIEYKGESKTIQQWAEFVGLDYFTLRARINVLGWDVERALNEKPRANRRSKE